jgi:hypothetical protein
MSMGVSRPRPLFGITFMLWRKNTAVLNFEKFSYCSSQYLESRFLLSLLGFKLMNSQAWYGYVVPETNDCNASVVLAHVSVIIVAVVVDVDWPKSDQRLYPNQ